MILNFIRKISAVICMQRTINSMVIESRSLKYWIRYLKEREELIFDMETIHSHSIRWIGIYMK